MTALYSDHLQLRTKLDSVWEVIADSDRKLNKRLTKVNHSKGWGAKPLV